MAKPTHTLRTAALLGLAALSLTACQTNRPMVEPVEPSWSYHDGGNSQLSNNDSWQRMLPESPLHGIGQAQVASVEDLEQ